MDEPDQPDPLSPLAAPALSAEIMDPDDLLESSAIRWLRDRCTRVFELAAARFEIRGQIRALVVNDEAMSAAHVRYSNIAGTTDVLTFDLSESESEIDADLFVCADEACRRAADLGHPVERELLLYVVHGLLHCLGHDDHDPEAFDAMHALEDELLTKAGIGVTFHASAAGPAEPKKDRDV